MNLSKKILSLVALIVFIVVLFCFGFAGKKGAFKEPASKDKGFAVIELFTSEGCSSCPSADELVSRLLSEDKKNVYILSYHVDYWNRLGWEDNFSDPAFSARQKQYAHYLSLEGVYTPQIVVNGTDQFVGSDESHLRSSIDHQVGQPANLSINAIRISNSNIRVSYKMPADNGLLLNIAILQPQGTTEVKRGENRGRELHHVNIVREFKTIEPGTGDLDIEIQKEISELPLKVIAFTQRKSNFQITGAVQTDVVISNKLAKK